MRAVIEKPWDPVSWDGDVWENPDEARDIESLNSGKTSLPVEAASSPPIPD